MIQAFFLVSFKLRICQEHVVDRRLHEEREDLKYMYSMDKVALKKKNEESVTSHRKLSWILPEERYECVCACVCATLKIKVLCSRTHVLDYLSFVFLGDRPPET